MVHFSKKQANNQHGKGKRPFKKKEWPRSSALTIMPKGILHEIALNLRRYLAILELVSFV